MRSIAATAGLALATVAAGSVILFAAAPAQAQCLGLGSPGTSVWYNYPQRAREEARSDTCNGDRAYRGRVYDIYTDGTCVQAYYADSGTVQGVSCDSAGYGYSYYDSNSDAEWWMRTSNGRWTDILRYNYQF